MAENLDPDTAPEVEEGAKPKKKGKLIVIILIVLIALGGGAAWWFMKGKKPSAPGPAAEKHEDPGKPPIFARLETFTVNLQRGDGDDHYLQVEIQLKVAEEKVNETLKVRMPEIRNALLLLLSSKTQEDLVTVEGKQKLAGEIVTQVNRIIGGKEGGKDGVLGVYFTSFVIQ